MSRRRARHLIFFEIAIWIVIIVAALVATAISRADPVAPGAPEKSAATATPAAPPEPEGYWTGAIGSAVPATIRGGTVIRTAQELQALLNGKVALIDASNLPVKPEKLAPNSPWIPAPHAAIPGTVWIPGSGMGEIAPEIETLYRDRLAAATGSNPDAPVVLYCHERCWLSYNAARRAISYGYRKVYWYPDGIEGWRAANLPTVTVTAVER